MGGDRRGVKSYLFIKPTFVFINLFPSCYAFLKFPKTFINLFPSCYAFLKFPKTKNTIYTYIYIYILMIYIYISSGLKHHKTSSNEADRRWDKSFFVVLFSCTDKYLNTFWINEKYFEIICLLSYRIYIYIYIYIYILLWWCTHDVSA